MRRLISLVLLPLAACHDFGESGLSTGPQPLNPPPGSTYWTRLSPQEKRAALRIIEQVYAEERLFRLRGQVAIVEGRLPGEALAIILQSPGSPERPIMVLSETAGDEAMFIGISAFAEGPGNPAHSADARVRWVALSQELSSAFQPISAFSISQSPGLRGSLAGRLQRDATSFTFIDLPGIGRGTLFRFD